MASKMDSNGMHSNKDKSIDSNTNHRNIANDMESAAQDEIDSVSMEKSRTDVSTSTTNGDENKENKDNRESRTIHD